MVLMGPRAIWKGLNREFWKARGVLGVQHLSTADAPGQAPARRELPAQGRKRFLIIRAGGDGAAASCGAELLTGMCRQGLGFCKRSLTGAERRAGLFAHSAWSSQLQ